MRVCVDCPGPGMVSARGHFLVQDKTCNQTASWALNPFNEFHSTQIVFKFIIRLSLGSAELANFSVPAWTKTHNICHTENRLKKWLLIEETC